MEFLKKIINKFFAKHVSDFPGAILDDSFAGSPTLNEVVAKAEQVVWKPLDLSNLPNLPVRNQNGSSSCVAFTLALIFSIMYFLKTGQWVDFSAAWVYQQRVNKPGEGMNAGDAFAIGEKGLIPDVLMPSDNKSEAEMNSPKVFAWFNKIAEVFGLDTRFIILPVKDIETIASTIQATGKPVMVWFEFGNGEWRKIPQILSSFVPYKHSVTALCPTKPGEMTFGIHEGEKAVVIQDSWGNDLETVGGKRIIKQSFFDKRNIFAAYPRKFKFESTIVRPFYDGTIVSVQKCLKSEGFFPLDVPFIENLGPLTREALRKFQKANNFVADGTLNVETRQLLKIRFN